MNKVISRKTIWLIVLAIVILICSTWSSFKIEQFEVYDFYPSEIKTNYRGILNSKHSPSYDSSSADLGYIPRLMDNNNLENTNQGSFLYGIDNKMNEMENNLLGIIEQPKYYNADNIGSITKEDPKGILRPKTQKIKSREHYDI